MCKEFFNCFENLHMQLTILKYRKITGLHYLAMQPTIFPRQIRCVFSCS